MAELTTALILSDEERDFLIDVLQFVGGSPTGSRRRHVKPLLDALDPNDERGDSGYDARQEYMVGSVYFKSE